MLVEKAAVGLVADAAEQGGDGCLDVADKPKIDRGSAADVFRILINLDFLHAMTREELREGKVSAEEQKEIGLMNSAVGSAVTEQAGHANGIRIVVFQPLFGAKPVSSRAVSRESASPRELSESEDAPLKA